MEQKDHDIHVSPRYRWIENGHILLWLVKDTCWAMEYKAGGIFMIFPTITVAFYILWKSRGVRSEFFHNIAVCFWILANSIWMVGEFYEGDARPIAVVLFATGLGFLIYYYARFFRNDQKHQREHALNIPKKEAVRSTALLTEAEAID